MPLFSKIIGRISPSLLRSIRIKLFTCVPQLLKVLPAKGRVLEIGCGYGHVSSHLAMQRPDLHFTGIDPDTDAIKVAEKSWPLPNLRFEAVSVENLREKFDLIMILDVIHHLPKDMDRSMVEHSARALNAGGKLLIKELRYDKRAVGVFLDTYVSRCPPLVRTDEQIRQALEPFFNVLSWETLDRMMMGQVYVLSEKRDRS